MDVKADAEVAKAEKPAGGDVEHELIGRLVDQAREQGLDLVGEGGLLQQLTKRVLESALEGPRTYDLPPHHRQLMPQHQDLRLLGDVRPRQQGEPAEKADEDEIEQT
jgi:hypothetical protein